MVDSAILGPDGRPMRRAALKTEQAGPTVAGVRQIWSDHPAAGITPGRMARLLREAEDGDATAYLELAEDIEERDLHYLGVIGTRKRSVAQLEIQVDAAGDDTESIKDADLVRDWLERDTLEDELFDILDAVGKGFSATEILWDTAGATWWPIELKRRDPRWFRFDRSDGETLKLLGPGGQAIDLQPWKFVVHIHKAKSGLPIRGGIARAAAWWWMFKSYMVKDWVTFCEVYGQPLRVGKYHAGASDAEKQVLLRAVSSIGTDAAAIMPDSMQIEFIKAEAARGTDVYQRFVDWIDQQCSKAVLGQTTTTDAISGGHAVAQEHRQVQEDIERADARLVGATLNRDLVRPLVAFNHGPRERYPRLRIGRSDQGPPLSDLMPATRTFVELGGRVGMSTVRDKLGYPDPAEDEELLRAPSALPARQAGDPAGAEDMARQAAGRQAPAPRDAADTLAEQLDGHDPLAPLIDRIRATVASADSIEDLQERLLELVADAPVEGLADEIREAMVLADLVGRDEIEGAVSDG